jgi:hypothetical protein
MFITADLQKYFLQNACICSLTKFHARKCNRPPLTFIIQKAKECSEQDGNYNSPAMRFASRKRINKVNALCKSQGTMLESTHNLDLGAT